MASHAFFHISLNVYSFYRKAVELYSAKRALHDQSFRSMCRLAEESENRWMSEVWDLFH
jgi:hypothetical protein